MAAKDLDLTRVYSLEPDLEDPIDLSEGGQVKVCIACGKRFIARGKGSHGSICKRKHYSDCVIGSIHYAILNRYTITEREELMLELITKISIFVRDICYIIKRR